MRVIMTTEIKYNGYNTVPSDYECADGDLGAAMNLIPEDGALHPILPPKVLTSFGDIEKAFIHKNGFTHYIVAKRCSYDTTNLFWCDAGDMVFSTTPFLTLEDGDTLKGFTAIGNIIVVSSAEHLHYCLWKNGGYVYLGTEIPNVPMRFALSGELMAKTYTALDFTTSTNTATSAQGWTAVATQGVSSTDKITYNGETVYVCKFPTSVKLAANTEYAFSASQWYGGFKSLAFYVFATADGGSTYTRVYAGKVSRHNHERTVLKFDMAYSNVCFAFGNYFRDDWANSAVLRENSVILEKGVSSALSYVIENNEANYNKLMSVMNNFSNNYATTQNRFIYPFFARYAVRLYDGSYTHISAPILLVPNSGYVPLMNFFSTGSSRGDIYAYAFIADLQYRVEESMPDEWKDIVSGVDIFVSQPIYPYDQGQEYSAYKEGLFAYKTIDYDAGVNELEEISYGDLSVSVAGNTTYYDHQSLYELLSRYHNFGRSSSKQWGVVQVAPVDDTNDKMAATSAFYLYKSLNFEDLTATEDPDQTDETHYQKGFVTVKAVNGALSTLVTRQTLPDELLASRVIESGDGFAYNNRLHLYNCAVRLPAPTQIQRQNAFFTPLAYGHTGSIGDYYGYVTDTYVYIHTDQGDKVTHVATDDADDMPWNLFVYRKGLHWFFYPDNRAYKAVFKVAVTKVGSGTSGGTVSIDLKRHETLNGAYWLADDLENYILFTPANSEDGEVSDAVDDTIANPSTVYVSEANNPFAFTSELSVSIGCNEIYALSSAVKAMSTGQFGQFPLYAFTDNGVWALETMANGAYSARQPVARDVCVYAQSITQLDGAVAFATNRGIMLLEGSETLCLSNPLAGVSKHNAYNLPRLREVSKMGDLLINDDGLTFLEYARGCRMIYDYAGQRLFVYNPLVTYAYVYSLKDKAWGMALTDIAQGINSYPEALAIDETGKLVDLHNPEAKGKVEGFLLTRPLKLDAPNAMKTIRAVVQRGYFKQGHVATLLYGSRDLNDWHLIASSQSHRIANVSGTPYKFFRVACRVSFVRGESVYGCSIDNFTRLTNKLR